jgi:hypothetical protein
MGILRVSNSFNFEKKIKSFCQPPRYELSKFEDAVAIIVVHPDASERMDDHVMMIRDVDDILQFSMASHIMVMPNEKIPHHLSSALLQINSDSMTGFWSLERMDDSREIAFVFSYNNNIHKMLLNKKLFDEVVTDMFDSCGDLYQMIESAEQAYQQSVSDAENGEHHEHESR